MLKGRWRRERLRRRRRALATTRGKGDAAVERGERRAPAADDDDAVERGERRAPAVADDDDDERETGARTMSGRRETTSLRDEPEGLGR